MGATGCAPAVGEFGARYWSELGSEMAQPRETRLEFLAGRLRHAKGSLDQLVKLQKEAQQDLAGRHKEQTEVRSSDELDAMLGAWRARGADQDDGMVSDSSGGMPNASRAPDARPACDELRRNEYPRREGGERGARQVQRLHGECERVKTDLKALEAQLKDWPAGAVGSEAALAGELRRACVTV